MAVFLNGKSIERNSMKIQKLISYCTIFPPLFSLLFAVDQLHAKDLDSPIGTNPKISPPNAKDSKVKVSTSIGWPRGKSPVAPAGFQVEVYAKDLAHPRWIYVLPNGDILVSEATGKSDSANQIEIFRGSNSDGTASLRKVFLKGLNQPFGMLLLNGWLYVANTDSIVRYRYEEGQTSIKTEGEKILDLPVNGHWTRNIISNPEGTKIYVAIGSLSNDAESGMKVENRRACIIEMNPDGSGEKIFATGLRNPVGLSFYPGSHQLWTVVNERDGLGDTVPPDYLAHVEETHFYGWPYSYWGNHEDPTHKNERPDLVKKAITPDFALGAHTAALGLEFYQGKTFPEKYRGGAFIGRHGSWNSSIFQGYDVYFVPFENGKPVGQGEPFLTGFIADSSKNEVYGRPVGVKQLPDGSLLMSDDSGGILWHVFYKKP